MELRRSKSMTDSSSSATVSAPFPFEIPAPGVVKLTFKPNPPAALPPSLLLVLEAAHCAYSVANFSSHTLIDLRPRRAGKPAP